jgi:hypothetical protein
MHLTSESFDDELNMLSRYTLNGLLYDVIAVLIFDTFENIDLEFRSEFGLLIRENMFESLYMLVWVVRRNKRQG